jgi:CRISPR/Cas system CMR-associated protein Cmr1 (group 7 of RAMP superfamily)
VPDARRSLDQITDLYVRERYAGQRASPQELRLVQRAWLSFRGALLRSWFRSAARARLRAVIEETALTPPGYARHPSPILN